MQRLFNRATKILLSTGTIALVAIAMLGPFYTIFVEKIGGNLLAASLTVAVFAVAAGVTTIIAGRYTNGVKEDELVVVLGYALMGLGFIFYIFVDSLFTLCLVQILIGIGGAIYAPAFEKLYTKHVKNCRVRHIWGAGRAMDYFSVAVGAVIGSLIVTHLGFEVLFILMAAFCFASAAYIYFLPRKVL